jgi:hypothetical protein
LTRRFVLPLRAIAKPRFRRITMSDLFLLELGDGSLLATLHAFCPIDGSPIPETTIGPLTPPVDLGRYSLQDLLGRLGKQAAYGLLFFIPIRRLQSIQRRLMVNLPTSPRAIKTWLHRAGRVCHQHRLAVALQASLLGTILLSDLVQSFWIPLRTGPLGLLLLLQLTLVLWLVAAVRYPRLPRRLIRALRRRLLAWLPGPGMPAQPLQLPNVKPRGWPQRPIDGLLRSRPLPRPTT